METLKTISVIGFVSHVGIAYYFNRWDNCYYNSEKIDLSEDAWKYEGASMESAQACFEQESCIGKLEVMNIEY